MRNKRVIAFISSMIFLFALLTGCGADTGTDPGNINSQEIISIQDIPEYTGEPYVALNGNIPEFDESDKTSDAFEEYSSLDYLGRCGVVYANIGLELMPTEERESIGMIKPSGWHTVRYDDLVDGNYLYNRCHLIGYQLSGENASEQNLITGTRYMNVDGMLPFEDMVADYVKETGNHVLYRVTPVFEGENLVATGVQMEAFSVEDEGTGIQFNVFCYNVQPGIIIDYSDGSSYEDQNYTSAEGNNQDAAGQYVLNTNTEKFHKPACASVEDMEDDNKEVYSGSRDDLINRGYSPCGRCKP